MRKMIKTGMVFFYGDDGAYDAACYGRCKNKVLNKKMTIDLNKDSAGTALRRLS